MSRPSVSGRGDLPPAAVDRLVRCCRLCAGLRAEGHEFVSSKEIGSALGCSPSQVRKDFSKLGRLGTRGSGYRIEELESIIGRLLGKDRGWDVVLVGAGSLGIALLNHTEFKRQGFRFVAVFDADPDKIGAKVAGLEVLDASRIPKRLRSLGADIGVIAVPAVEAKRVAGLLERGGIRAILSFAPADLRPGEGTVVSNVDLSTEFEKLCYYLMAAKA